VEPVDACAIAHCPERWSGCVEETFLSWLVWFLVVCIIVYILFQAVFEYVCDFKVGSVFGCSRGCNVSEIRK
jgi:hypothetical protein